MSQIDVLQHQWHSCINLVDSRLGAKVLTVTDEFFGACDRLLNPNPPIFVEGKYDENGKWMDGWESRRKRYEGFDHCIIRLGVPGCIKGIDLDTSHFIGNFPPAASIEACYCPIGDPTDYELVEGIQWVEILSTQSLQADSHHFFDIKTDQAFTHIKLNIYPDGGVARLRVYGEPHVNWEDVNPLDTFDLASVAYGGKALACSDQSFGSDMMQITMPYSATHMGDGWETARRRVPGNEWVIIALGHPGILRQVIIDTAFFKGNYPDKISIQGSYLEFGSDQSIVAQSMYWQTVLPEQPLKMDAQCLFSDELFDVGALTHVRVNSIPDGGISRVRLLGQIERL